MRSIELSTAFKRDYKHAKANPHYAPDVRSLVESVALLLANDEDEPLPDSYREHALSGDWKGYRECHLKPDLLLILQDRRAGHAENCPAWFTF